jgi:peptide/nickel transport system substrate-binding protein
MVDEQSMETDLQKRKEMVWKLDANLQERAVRPVLYAMRQATCWRPEVKGIKLQSNSIYNDWRFEDVWLDK